MAMKWLSGSLNLYIIATKWLENLRQYGYEQLLLLCKMRSRKILDLLLKSDRTIYDLLDWYLIGKSVEV